MNNVKLEGSTMPIVNYPKIRPTDYALFRGVLHGDLPASYEEWFDLARKELREIVVNGDTPREIETDPDEFARYCHVRRYARTLDRLKRFASEKGSGNSY
jgi:hypothetical protein